MLCTGPLTKFAMPFDDLPTELCLEIFRWAITSPICLSAFATSYEPFMLSTHTHFRADFIRTLTVKLTIILVCRRWNAIAMELLCEDLWVGPGRDTFLLQRLLQRTQNNTEYGTYVRRILLPYPTTTKDPVAAIDILRLCHKLEVLVRPTGTLERSQLRYNVRCPPLPSLKRIDWWYDRNAEQFGGINSLESVLHSTPNIQYLSLSVGSDSLPNYGPLAHSNAPPHLPLLTTLRVRRFQLVSLERIRQWSLPALTHLIADFPGDLAFVRLSPFGSQLRTVDIGLHVAFIRYNVISAVLWNCPKLTQLNYFIYFTHPPELKQEHKALSVIGLHAAPNLMLCDGREWEHDWKRLELHVLGLTGQLLPALKRIELFGEWHDAISDPRFIPLKQRLHTRGCVLILHEDNLLRVL
jgi:hypothetical protein